MIIIHGWTRNLSANGLSEWYVKVDKARLNFRGSQQFDYLTHSSGKVINSDTGMTRTICIVTSTILLDRDVGYSAVLTSNAVSPIILSEHGETL